MKMRLLILVMLFLITLSSYTSRDIQASQGDEVDSILIQEPIYEKGDITTYQHDPDYGDVG
ncbi:hypothetical protein [Aquibacillus kalidii]|uniref:hypothetical protein n=1 Tax=Aquibacillus kalidii TaxID=2762597 RepID=UPI001645A80B|nr:hypothetical protein [Aquibacillus kalidii]